MAPGPPPMFFMRRLFMYWPIQKKIRIGSTQLSRMERIGFILSTICPVNVTPESCRRLTSCGSFMRAVL